MVVEDHSVLLEDNRFIDSAIPDLKDIPPQIHWYLYEDYLVDEMILVDPSELTTYKSIAQQAYNLILEYTDDYIRKGDLSSFGISSSLIDLIKYSWEHRDRHPYLYGRFDVNGVLDQLPGAVIEFNADTCSTLGESIHWQRVQLKKTGIPFNECFNDIEEHLQKFFAKHNTLNGDHRHVIIGSSLGYKEDVLNTNIIIDQAMKHGLYGVYSDLENVVFSENEGIFVDSHDTYYQADFFFKFFPWDWIDSEEPELLSILHKIITNELCTVLNPAYSFLWQNKAFLAHITKDMPSQSVIAKTYFNKDNITKSKYVRKPVLGRLGESIKVVDQGQKVDKSKGDYDKQEKIYQEFVQNPTCTDDETYQAGVFITDEGPAGLNFRASESSIITDDCEFYTHVIREL